MLELKNVTKTFNPGTVNEKVALKNLNLVLNDGDFVTVIGGNGAGKSTMLNAIAGVWKPDEGQILIDGVDVTGMVEYKRAKKEEYMSLLSEFGLGLEHRLTSKVGLLSGGQRQAVTLLMATLNKPKLLLLDEHTAALDPATAAKVMALTDQVIEEEGLTALMVTHNMQDAITHGNRLIMMHDGGIIFDISGEEKKKLTIEDLLEKFRKLSGTQFANDRALLG